MTGLPAVLEGAGLWTSETEDGEPLGTGSCWAIREDLVVTNLHVASMGSRATVEFEAVGTMPVLGLVAVDKPRDIAIAKLRTGGRTLRSLKVEEQIPSVGTDVFVVGSPLGLRQSVSRGIVSAIRPAADLATFGVVGRKTDRFIQIDAAISHGSSGGPIVNSAGSVLAVSTLLISGGQSLNFGVPAAYVGELLDLAGECRALSNFVDMNRAVAEGAPEAGAKSAFAGVGQASVGLRTIDHIARLYLLVIHADGDVSETENRVVALRLNQIGFPHTDLDGVIQGLIDDLRVQSYDDLATHSAFRLSLDLEKESLEGLFADLTGLAAEEGLDPSEVGVLNAIKRAWDGM
jgi:hypothetical protein